MIFVVDAISRFACGCFTQSTAPVVLSTRIPERAPILGEPWADGAVAFKSFGGARTCFFGGAGGAAAAAGAVWFCR